MLTRLELENFKAFGEQACLNLRPLTIFVGPNGSGKSSVLEAVGLLSQSTPAPEQPAQLKWKDRHVDFGSSGSAAFHKPEHDLHLSLTVEVEAGEHFRTWMERQHYEPESIAESLGYRVGYRRATDEWKHQLLIDGEVAAVNHTLPIGRGPLRKAHGSVLECNFPASVERVYEPALTGNAVLAPKLFVGTRAVGGNEVSDAAQRHFIAFGWFMSYVAGYLKQRVFMVGANRMPSREIPQADSGPLSVGRRGERTLTVLSVIFANPRHLAQARKIQDWASTFGLPSLTSGWVREELLHAGYLDSTFDTALGFESAGCGAQNVLPVITQIFAAPNNSVILIEEPETGLHPDAQADLARMFADAVSQGQQLLVTTHSREFLNALSEVTESAKINYQDVAVYRCTKSPRGAVAMRVEIAEAAPENTKQKAVPINRVSRSAGA